MFSFLFPLISDPLILSIQDFFNSIAEFFKRYGEIGLFIYSIIETITPLAGVEIILIPLILTSSSPWWFITFILVSANAVGAFIVYFFMSKGENRFYNRLVSQKNQIKAKQMFNRYGFWAIFIFAMTPLPFFVILFTASIAKMRFLPYLTAAFVSRGVRFYITGYLIFVFGETISTGQIVLWLAIIGLGIGLLSMIIQRQILKYYEGKIKEDSNEDPSS